MAGTPATTAIRCSRLIVPRGTVALVHCHERVRPGPAGRTDAFAQKQPSEIGRCLQPPCKVEDDQSVYRPGTFALVRHRQRHTWWNSGEQTAVFLTLISPPGLKNYFAELAAGLARTASRDEAAALRNELSTRYDVEMVGPPIIEGKSPTNRSTSHLTGSARATLVSGPSPP